MADSFVNQR